MKVSLASRAKLHFAPMEISRRRIVFQKYDFMLPQIAYTYTYIIYLLFIMHLQHFYYCVSVKPFVKLTSHGKTDLADF